MKTRKGKVEVRCLKANASVMYEADGLLLERGVEIAETYLRGKGLMAEYERLYSVERGITGRKSMHGATFSATPISFGVMKLA